MTQKSFLIHFVASILSALMVIYIMGDEQTTPIIRWVICFFILFVQFICMAFCDIKNIYDKKNK